MEGGREGGREGWKEGGREGGRQAGREEEREGVMEGGREGGREAYSNSSVQCPCPCTASHTATLRVSWMIISLYRSASPHLCSYGDERSQVYLRIYSFSDWKGDNALILGVNTLYRLFGFFKLFPNKLREGSTNPNAYK